MINWGQPWFTLNQKKKWNKIIICFGELTLMVATTTNLAVDFYTFYPFSLFTIHNWHENSTELDEIPFFSLHKLNSYKFDSNFKNCAECVRVDVWIQTSCRSSVTIVFIARHNFRSVPSTVQWINGYEFQRAKTHIPTHGNKIIGSHCTWHGTVYSGCIRCHATEHRFGALSTAFKMDEGGAYSYSFSFSQKIWWNREFWVCQRWIVLAGTLHRKEIIICTEKGKIRIARSRKYEHVAELQVILSLHCSMFREH